jgi:hypothetical protein
MIRTTSDPAETPAAEDRSMRIAEWAIALLAAIAAAVLTVVR